MTDQNYIDMGGVENLAVAMIRQARGDFIKGGLILYGIFGKIPTQEELYKDRTHATLTNNSAVRWMYDAWRFVRDDPYSMFGDGEKIVIDAWTKDVIKEHFKKIYLHLGALVYSKHPKDKHIQNLSNDELCEYLPNKEDADKLSKAIDYISHLSDSKEVFKEWNSVAYKRRNEVRVIKRSQNGDNFRCVNQEKMDKRRKNANKVKELYESGMSRQAIAKYMGLHIATINNYLRS